MFNFAHAVVFLVIFTFLCFFLSISLKKTEIFFAVNLTPCFTQWPTNSRNTYNLPYIYTNIKIILFFCADLEIHKH